MVNVLVQSPMVSRRRSSTRMVKRDSLNRMGSIGPISRRGSLLGADGQPSSPSKGPRDEEHADLAGSARPPAGPTIKEERSLEELSHVDSEELQGRTAGSGAGAASQPREVEMPPRSRSSAAREAFYHS